MHADDGTTYGSVPTKAETKSQGRSLLFEKRLVDGQLSYTPVLS